MNNISIDNLFIIDLFNLEPKDIKTITFKRSDKDDSVFFITLNRDNRDDGTVAVHNRKINNAIIENRNKCIKHNSNGYTNWFRFCNRVLYVLRPDATVNGIAVGTFTVPKSWGSHEMA